MVADNAAVSETVFLVKSMLDRSIYYYNIVSRVHTGDCRIDGIAGKTSTVLGSDPVLLGLPLSLVAPRRSANVCMHV